MCLSRWLQCATKWPTRWPSRALRAWTAKQALPRDQERAFELGVMARCMRQHREGQQMRSVNRSASWIVSVKEALRKFEPKRLRLFG